MDKVDNFIKDIYSQMFYTGTLINPTRFFIISALFNSGIIKDCYNRYDVEKYIYYMYADNDDIARRHPRLEIRNIKQYGEDVIKEELQAALEIWDKEAKNHSIRFDLTHIWVDLSPNDVDSIPYIKMVLEELFKKVFHINYPRIQEVIGTDIDIYTFGSGAYKNHLTAEMQYCVCCDEYTLTNLVAVHIVADKDSQDSKSREDTSNGLLMCKEHAQEYLHGRFYFDENGKVVNIKSCLVQKNMRLGVKLLTPERRKYLKESTQLNKK